MGEMTREEKDKIIKHLIKKNHLILQELADDEKDMRIIVIRDSCPLCRKRTYPCSCFRDKG